jgi:hypothetical protein
MHHKLVAVVYRGRYVRVSIFARKYREEQSLVGSTGAFSPRQALVRRSLPVRLGHRLRLCRSPTPTFRIRTLARCRTQARSSQDRLDHRHRRQRQSRPPWIPLRLSDRAVATAYDLPRPRPTGRTAGRCVFIAKCRLDLNETLSLHDELRMAKIIPNEP